MVDKDKGLVEITKISADAISGTVNYKDGGDHATGGFTVPICTAKP